MALQYAYLPDRDDRILTGLVSGWKLTDGETAERMGFPVKTITEQRERLGLAKNPSFYPPKPKARPDALSIAAEHLKGFNREAMTLNGRPIKLQEAMRRTNAELVRKGLPQVEYCPAWVIHP